MINQKDYEVIVVGAGPAGSCAALALAREGVKVAVIDRAQLPRQKTCAGGIVHRALRHMPIDIRSVVDRKCFTVQFNLPASSLCFSISRDQPIISMTMRDKFDHLLVSEAQKAGAKIMPACEVFDLRQGPNSIVLETARGRHKARFVIGADGALSRVARSGGWQETRQMIPALECRVGVDDRMLDRFSQAARFDFDLIPDGYAWAFPKKDHLSIGIVRIGRQSSRLHDAVTRYAARLGIESSARLKPRGFLIPISPRKDGLIKGRILLVGDAAGLADPITAEGIFSAVLSGQIAAEALIGGGFETESVKERFHREMNRQILRDLKSGRLAGNFFYRYPKVRNRVFRRFGEELTEAMARVAMGEITYEAVMKSPLNYLKLLSVWKS